MIKYKSYEIKNLVAFDISKYYLNKYIYFSKRGDNIMIIKNIKNRSIIFTHENLPEWDLHLHLILGNKHNFLIDTGLGSLSVEPVKEVLKNSPKPLIVINSHYHWDHVWGNDVFKGSTIISHSLCREILEQRWEQMLEENGRYTFGTIEKELPNLTFNKELYFPEDKIRIFYTPGHTSDSISVLDEEEKILNVADNIGDNNDEIVPGLECGKDVYMDTLKIYKNIDFDTCISSHNKLLGKDVIDLILGKL